MHSATAMVCHCFLKHLHKTWFAVADAGPDAIKRLARHLADHLHRLRAEGRPAPRADYAHATASCGPLDGCRGAFLSIKTLICNENRAKDVPVRWLCKKGLLRAYGTYEKRLSVSSWCGSGERNAPTRWYATLAV